jgi:hypothetical protein
LVPTITNVGILIDSRAASDISRVPSPVAGASGMIASTRSSTTNEPSGF